MVCRGKRGGFSQAAGSGVEKRVSAQAFKVLEDSM